MNRFASIASTALLVATTSIAAPTTYTVDPSHTAVTAESRHFGTSTVRSHFQAKSGSVTIDPAARTGSATIDIDVASVMTGVPALDEKLKGDGFFDVASYPDATFAGTTFTFDGDKITSISGELTMHGRKIPVTLTATRYDCYPSPNFMKIVCGGDFETTISRKLWDIRALIPFVSDETGLKIEIEVVKD